MKTGCSLLLVGIIGVGLLALALQSLNAAAEERQIVAEAQRAQAVAHAAQALAEQERAAGERAILEAAARAVDAQRPAPFPWLLVSGLTVLVVGSVVVLAVVVLRATQPRLAPPTTDWQIAAARWQTLALFLAASLRNKPTLTAAERHALAAVEQAEERWSI